jgi:hypothetical protein
MQPSVRRGSRVLAVIRRSALLCAAVAAVWLAASPAALAQTPDEAAAAVRDRGFYVEPGADVDTARISDAIASASEDGIRLFVVLLDEDPPGGAATFAGAVLDRLGGGTVLVLSASDLGMESTEFDAADLEDALDAGLDAGVTDADIVEGVAASLAGEGRSGGGSRAGLFILLGIVAVLIGLVWWAIRRQRTAAARSEEKLIEEARAEIKSQLDAMANLILEISDRVSASDTKEDNRYLEEAGATYGTALEEYEGATDLHGLEELSDRLDEARWQLDAAAALADGRPAPPKPEKEVRHQCFFDPNHPEATEIADLETPAGTRKIRVCQEDAEKLRRGEQPEPRMIRVAGRRVPAPAAPRSHGGGGFGGLDVFSVLVGGMARGRSYDWSRKGSSTGGFGGSAASASRSRSGASASRRSRASRSRRRRR